MDQERVAPLVATLEQQLDQQYARPHIKRDAHPKMHGCVQAILKVDDAAGSLRKGIFAKPREYPAWVRFSNAFGIQHDLEFETRGMAIKLLGVEGERALPDGLEHDRERETQDFLFATHDAFFIPSDEYDYKAFAEATVQGQWAVFKFFWRSRILGGWWALIRSALVLAANPLAITYYSQTPYRFGEIGPGGEPGAVVKLRARPVLSPALQRSLPVAFWFRLKAAAATGILSVAQSRGAASKRKAEEFCDRYIAPRDLLRQALMATLAIDDATFEIAVQFQRPGDPAMPLDDATKRWSEARSPFHRVATLRIPRQVFWAEAGMPERLRDATERMMTLGENMSFNPWHARVEHTPLGSINEMRRHIYTAIAAFRRGRNEVHQPVPTEAEYHELREMVQTGLVDGPIARTPEAV